jgi:lipopolysaccharide/colanic/teichoic acid biosynthesis glycosyltransferase
MKTSRFESIVLFGGDIAILCLSLWLSLFARFLERPQKDLFFVHLVPFSLLFLLTVFIFLISGLYDKHTATFKKKLRTIILKSQVFVAIIAITMFYFIPLFGVAPKRILFIYILISTALFYIWRSFGPTLISTRKKESAILIGAGKDYDEFIEEVTKNPSRYWFTISNRITTEDSQVVETQLKSSPERIFILDLNDKKLEPAMPILYEKMVTGSSVIDFLEIYENIFDRIPLSTLNYSWVLRHGNVLKAKLYDIPKRFMDMSISVVLGLLILPFIPLIMLAIYIDSGAPVFITQERIGLGGKILKLYKFRSMISSDSGKWQTNLYENITRVGKFIRKTRLDETPQIWNVLSGDLSLVGPRPDIIDLGKELVGAVPYYSVRTCIKPGLSGWAQIRQYVPPHSIEETKVRLSYDLYYVKNRSFMFDVVIALKTIKTLLSTAGK